MFRLSQLDINEPPFTMVGARQRKGYSMSWPTQLQMGTKNGINDDQRIDIIMDYLQDRAPRLCFNADSNYSLRRCGQGIRQGTILPTLVSPLIEMFIFNG